MQEGEQTQIRKNLHGFAKIFTDSSQNKTAFVV